MLRLAPMPPPYAAPAAVRLDLTDDVAGPDPDGATAMLEEIHEQGAGVARTLHGRVDRLGAVTPESVGLTQEQIGDVSRLRILGCGSSLHAGLAAQRAIERWARIPVAVEDASAFLHHGATADPSELVVAVSQSGETPDTLAAMRMASEAGAPVLALTNTEDSPAAREGDGLLLTRAGDEDGVAAARTFAAQSAALALLGLALAGERHTLSPDGALRLAAHLRTLPRHLDEAVRACAPGAAALAPTFADAERFVVLGTDCGSATAAEGALALEDLTGVPAHACSPGGIEHDEAGLVDAGTIVVVCATQAPTAQKLDADVATARARGARVVAIVTEGDEHRFPVSTHVFAVPRTAWLMAPLVAAVPLQLLAHDVAAARDDDERALHPAIA